MTRWKIVISAAAAFLYSAGAANATFAGEVSPKPSAHTQVSIAPARSGVQQKSMRPGDVVELKISAFSFRGGDSISVDITLLDGVELVSGDLHWEGMMAKGEMRDLLIGVRVPTSGYGRVKAVISSAGATGQRAVKQRIYVLGDESRAAKGKPGPPVKKDSRGRSVVEY